jgi:hypothetical protein
MSRPRAGAGLAVPNIPRAIAQKGRSLHLEIQGFSLAIHIPEVIAIREELPRLGYDAPKVDRIESMQVLTQSIVAGSAEAGDADVVSAIRASEVGADVRLIGLVYNNTSQVLVVNSDKVKSYDDLKDPRNAIALNSRGDFIYVMLSGVLARSKIDIEDTTIVEIGGSGSRMRALLGGRVAAVPVHFDQAEAIIKQGNYRILIEPWKTYTGGSRRPGWCRGSGSRNQRTSAPPSTEQGDDHVLPAQQRGLRVLCGRLPEICDHQGRRQDRGRRDQADLAEAVARHQGLAERRRVPPRILQGASPGLSQGRRDQGRA